MILVSLVTALTVTTVVLHWSACAAEASQASPLQSDLKDLVNKRRSLSLLRIIIDDLDSSLYALNKHVCSLNLAGYDCDRWLESNDYLSGGGGEDGIGQWSGPDQKRAPCLNFDGTACVTAQTAEEMKNRKGWKVGPGRRKRRAASAAN